VDALAEQGLRPQVADQLRGLAGPLASGIQRYVRTEVGKIVQTQAFADAWTQANRLAHQALVKALTGQGDGAVTVEGDTVNWMASVASGLTMPLTMVTWPAYELVPHRRPPAR
jgi:hypothetical protein